MLARKVAACWLILLALSPFTAPFATCDLTTLSSGVTSQTAHLTTFSPLGETLVDELLAQLHAPEAPAASRTKYFVQSRSVALGAAPVSARTLAPTAPAAIPVGWCAPPKTLRI